MTNAFGISHSDLFIIVSVLRQYEQVTEAYLFGSRAKGNFKTSSDVDIALKGDRLNLEMVTDISYHLNEETYLPYKFDILNYHHIINSDLKQHIDRVGICFYPESEKK
jgi:uncharacterized protein